MMRQSTIPEFVDRARDRLFARSPLPRHLQRAIDPHVVDGIDLAQQWQRASFVPVTASQLHGSPVQGCSRKLTCDESGDIVVLVANNLEVFRAEQLLQSSDSRQCTGDSILCDPIVSLCAFAEDPWRCSVAHMAACFVGEAAEILGVSVAHVNSILFFDLETVDDAAPAPVLTAHIRHGFATDVCAVTNCVVAAATSSGTVELCDTRHGKVERLFFDPAANKAPISFGQAIRGKPAALTAMVRDGVYFATGSADGTVAVWDIRFPSSNIARRMCGVSLASLAASEKEIVCNTVNGTVTCFEKALFFAGVGSPVIDEALLNDGARTSATVNLPPQQLIALPDAFAVPCYCANELVFLGHQKIDDTSDSSCLRELRRNGSRAVGSKSQREELGGLSETAGNWGKFHSVPFGTNSFPVVTCGLWLEHAGRLLVANDAGFIEATC